MTGATVFGLPLLYLIGPLLLFGPIFLFIAYSLGLGNLFRRDAVSADADGAAGKVDQRAREVRQLRDAAWFLGRSGGKTAPRRPGVIGYAFQGVLFAAFSAFIAAFAAGPTYRVLAEGDAVVKLTMSYPAERKEACRQRSREELQKLPPNMRAPQQCSRTRWPARLRLSLDGALVFDRTVKPSGLSGDGPSVFYARFSVPAGAHVLAVRLQDAGGDRPPFEFERKVDLESSRVLVVGYDENARKITLR